MALIKGIDVSVWNGSIDWKKASKEINFAILRAGFGRTSAQKDKKFEENYKGCKNNNVPVGVYWYNYAKTVADAKTEAKACLEVLKNKDLDYPVWYDIEESATLKTGKTNVSNIAKAFLEVIEKAGYKVGIYSMKSGLDSYFTDAVKKKYDIWVAHVGKNGAALSSTSYRGHTIWQYSWKGKVSGISGDVDLDYCYKNYVTTDKEDTKSETTTNKTESTKTDSDKIDVIYNAYTTKWLGEVKNYNDNDINGYAGLDNVAMSGFSAKSSKGILKYRVHTKNGRWLNWISTYNIEDWNKGVAGIKGRYIDGIQFDFSGVSGYKVKYRVSVQNVKGYLPWVTGYNNTSAGYAGVFGRLIDKIQVKIEK